MIPFLKSKLNSIGEIRWLWTILILAAILRIATAFTSIGFDHPNEIYRLLEVMADLQGYSTRMAWESQDGILSEISPRFHLGLVQIFEALGIDKPFWQSISLRLLYALLSLFLPFSVWRLLKCSGARPVLALTATAMTAFWPEWIYRSVRLMDYSLEASLLAMVLILTLTVKEKHRLLSLSVAGGLLGFCFFIRYQSGIHFISLFSILAYFSFYKRESPSPLKELSVFTLSYGGTIALIALYEAGGIQGFLSPFWEYFRFNVLEAGAARYYGTDPWHRYISESAKVFGFLPLLVLLGLALSRTSDKKLVFLALLPTLALSLTSHKEGRFILGSIWVLFPASLSALRGYIPTCRSLSLFVIVFLVGAVINGIRVTEHFKAGSASVQVFSQLGETLKQNPKWRKAALTIDADPDFVAGGFFLQHEGPLCYRFQGKEVGDCSREHRAGFALTLTQRGKEPMKERTLKEFGKSKNGWKLIGRL